MIYEHLLAALQKEPVVVATVIKVKGSVPREVGAKMLITASGCVDTIGGGAGEAKAIAKAKEVLQTGIKTLVEIDLTGAANHDRPTEGICGGWMEVLLERWQGEQAIALVSEIITNLRSGKEITLVTPLPQNVIIDGSPRHLLSQQPDSFIEVLKPEPMLLIVGAGHVGEQLAKIAHLSGFQIAIQDDRPEWANRDRYPQAAFIYSSITQALTELAHHQELYVTLVTRGYRYDLEALKALLERQKSCCYIGMIGSDRRVKQVLAEVKREVSIKELPSIHAPIGLDIGALTPAEIAVSIVAELIMVRRGGSGRSLSKVV
ncbi:XdhC family protein [Pseudanabaena sp. FACHB-1998]|uniref:XdhC family protein n=1 Tax=Pseudanabaena sp. FACHB-1998 TaxID=2692858 RepID=UPI00168126AE|nr:XdhC/CoxI family protein [Pseudanabaena sp. FACHB-1998]MBD2178665.1 XdhC family protein [Pseudanabaena sp. FACHB-1998]